MAKDNTAFIGAHPELAARFREEGLDWLNDYTDYDGSKIREKWIRDENGTLVDVSEKYRLRQELEEAQEELNRINALEERARGKEHCRTNA